MKPSPPRYAGIFISRNYISLDLVACSFLETRREWENDRRSRTSYVVLNKNEIDGMRSTMVRGGTT